MPRHLPPRSGRILSVLLLTALAQPAMAHPHAFIDATLTVLVDAENRATGLRIQWVYDPLTTLMILEAQQLDRDFDGQLTPQETQSLQGFDMHWQPGFPGDTYALQANLPLELGPPVEAGASYGDEQITSWHLRMFDAPVSLTTPLVVQSYDPEYYTAYTVDDALAEGGSGCTAQVFTPDLSEADIAMQATLEQYGPEVDLAAEFPLVGAAYAEEARVTCPQK